MYHSIVAVQCFYRARVFHWTPNNIQGYSDCQLYFSGTSSKTNCWIRKGIQQPSGSVATKLLFPGCFISWTWSHRLLLASPTILPNPPPRPSNLRYSRASCWSWIVPLGCARTYLINPTLFLHHEGSVFSRRRHWCNVVVCFVFVLVKLVTSSRRSNGEVIERIHVVRRTII